MINVIERLFMIFETIFKCCFLSKRFKNNSPIFLFVFKLNGGLNTNSRPFMFNEKYEIATYTGDNLLNKRTEIINTSRHRSKYKLANCDTID